jgi:hypothetical protein
MKPAVLFRKWHKWLALVVGVQFFFWTLSGLFMSAVPIDKVRSEHLVKKQASQVLSLGVPYISINSVIKLFDEDYSVLTIKLGSLLTEPMYFVETSDGRQHIVDALRGEIISPLDKERAKSIARANYNKSTDGVTANLIIEPLTEYRGKYPVWRVDFNNLENTSFYVSPESGNLQARRGLLWRIYDFLWMLHIMDYRTRSDFNNWFLIVAAFLALSATISGIGLIKFSFRKRDFRFSKHKNR